MFLHLLLRCCTYTPVQSPANAFHHISSPTPLSKPPPIHSITFLHLHPCPKPCQYIPSHFFTYTPIWSPINKFHHISSPTPLSKALPIHSITFIFRDSCPVPPAYYNTFHQHPCQFSVQNCCVKQQELCYNQMSGYLQENCPELHENCE
jgi:hypothetical protein